MATPIIEVLCVFWTVILIASWIKLSLWYYFLWKARNVETLSETVDVFSAYRTMKMEINISVYVFSAYRTMKMEINISVYYELSFPNTNLSSIQFLFGGRRLLLFAGLTGNWLLRTCLILVLLSMRPLLPLRELQKKQAEEKSSSSRSSSSRRERASW